MITHGPNHKTNKAKSIYHNNCQKQNTDMNTEGELTGVVASAETSRGPGSTTRAYGFPSGPRTGQRIREFLFLFPPPLQPLGLVVWVTPHFIGCKTTRVLNYNKAPGGNGSPTNPKVASVD